MIALIDLIRNSRQTFVATEHCKHIKHARRRASTGQGGSQGLRGSAKLQPVFSGKFANCRFRRGCAPFIFYRLKRCVRPAQNGAGRFAKQRAGLLVHRQRPLGKQKCRAVGQFDKRLGALLEAGHRRQQLRLALVVQAVGDTPPFSR